MKPSVVGVERTRLEDLKIGDYIKWGYKNFDIDKCGELFSEGLESLPELPIASGNDISTNINVPVVNKCLKGGYFYFIKYDKGSLIADRLMPLKLSPKSINMKNYYKSEKYFCVANQQEMDRINQLSNVFTQGYDFFNSISSRSAYHIYPIFQTNEFQDNSYWHGGYDSYTGYYHFLPLMNYVDNPKSTNIFY